MLAYATKARSLRHRRRDSLVGGVHVSFASLLTTSRHSPCAYPYVCTQLVGGCAVSLADFHVILSYIEIFQTSKLPRSRLPTYSMRFVWCC
jgi:hypothetical protein